MDRSKAISRAELYTLVWREPRTTLAKEFGVSDVALGKICRAAGIPVPPQGYWAKKKAGKAAEPPPLPPREPGVSEEIEIGTSRYGSSQRLSDSELRNAELSPPLFPESLDSVRSRIRPRLGKITAPKTLNRPHRTIARLLADDETRREKIKDAAFVFDWDKPRFDSRLQQRRLRILSGIFAGLARFGCKATLDRREATDISVVVGDQHVSLALEEVEQKTRSNVRPSKQLLRLTLKGRSWLSKDSQDISWEDSKELKLESQLTAICEEILVSGERQYRENEMHQYRWELERKEELEEKDRQRRETEARVERERLEKEAHVRIQMLLDAATAHRQANDVRDYIQCVLKAASDGNISIPSEQLSAWAHWAHSQANALDPVKSGQILPHLL